MNEEIKITLCSDKTYNQEDKHGIRFMCTKNISISKNKFQQLSIQIYWNTSSEEDQSYMRKWGNVSPKVKSEGQ